MAIRILMAFEWIYSPSTHSKFELVREFFWRGTKSCSKYRNFRIKEVRIVESDLLEFPRENWRWMRFRSNYRKIRIIEVRISESLLLYTIKKIAMNGIQITHFFRGKKAVFSHLSNFAKYFPFINLNPRKWTLILLKLFIQSPTKLVEYSM